MSEHVLSILRSVPLIAILRGVPARHVVTLAEVLLHGGVRALEVTMTDPDAVDKIELLRAALPKEACIGAGTVTSDARAIVAHAAGAEYLVTPHVCPDVNAFGLAQRLPIIGGALAPTEVARSVEGGCAFVKLFPAAAYSPSYVTALLGPYPDLNLIVVGGIGRGNLASFLSAGAVGAGVGGALTSLDWERPDFARVRKLAVELVEITMEHQPRAMSSSPQG